MTMNKNKLFWMSFVLMLAFGMSSCSNDDDDVTINSPTALYAIVKPEGAVLFDIIPSDYVMTLDNIIAANPVTGEFKMRNTEAIDSKAYPYPTQYVIQFYSDQYASEGSFLFEAKLNSSLSSYLPSGLTFCHFLTDRNGISRYDLGTTLVLREDGTTDGKNTDQQAEGVKRMFQILQQAGKTSTRIDYDFKFK